MKAFRKWITRLSISLLLLAAAGCNALTGNTATTLQASGIIEAEQINATAQLPGQVTAVNVAERQSVKSGEVLFTLDDSILKAQRQAAAAVLATSQKGVDSAQAVQNTAQLQYDTTLSNALAAEQSTSTADWIQSKPAAFGLPTWY